MTDHYLEAERALERADEIANSDSRAYGDDRQMYVANYLARAQAHATLALAKETREHVKATYSGGGI